MHRLTLSVLLVIAPFASAQRDAKIPDTDPEVERKSFLVAPGFEVSLYAADPLLAKPIQMNFDPQGRLWVATSETYPQIKPGDKANDKIIILEDTNKDGVADKTTVFADGLLIPTGVAPGDGGAYVANSTELLHITKTADGKTHTRVVLSGFGTEDTHHILHTLRWGPDSRLYMNQSIYIHSHIETPFGVARLNGGGIWRFTPEATKLSVFARGWVNTWGHQFDKYGNSFVTDGAGGEGINYAVPGASYVTAVGASRILPGLNPGSPKYCGLAIVDGRHLPDDWQGNLITNDFRGHRVCRFTLRDDGSTYESRQQPDLIRTTHGAFRPIDVAMGPDGAIYIADWYNPIIQHGEVDFRDPRRDHTHGRIWRVTAKGRPPVRTPDLTIMTGPELLAQLDSPEGFSREQAKRVLHERGAKVLPAVAAWADDRPAGFDGPRLENLWVQQGFDKADPALLTKLLASATPGVRSAAVRVLADTAGALSDTRLALLAKLAADPYPRVRLEAVRALAKETDPKAVEAALTALDHPMDSTLDYALWLTVRELEPVWLPAFEAGTVTFGGDVRKIEFALKSSGSGRAAAPLLALLKAGRIPADRAEAAWGLVARVGGPGELEAVLDRALDRGTPKPVARDLLLGLDEAARTRGVKPSGDLKRVSAVLISEDTVFAPAAVLLVGRWKLPLPGETLLGVMANKDDAALEIRLAAVRACGLHGSAKSVETLVAIGTDGPPTLRRAAVIALADIDLPKAAGFAAKLLATDPAADDLQPVVAAFLARKTGPQELLKAVAGKPLPADAAKVAVRAVRASGQNHPTLIDAFTKAGNLTAVKPPATPADVSAYVIAVKANSDPIRGEAIYRRADLKCLTCHAVGGAGGKVGPDMTSIGASAQVDYLVESLLLPNKAVKEGYHAVVANTTDGKLVTGVKVRDTDTALLLRTAEDAEISIPKADLDGPPKPSRSLMPDGLTDQLTKQEFADLVRFLSELGKVGPYAPSPARLVRRWQVIPQTRENGDYLRRTRLAAAAENPKDLSWTTVTSRVAGELPLTEVPQFPLWNGSAPQSVVRFQLDVTQPGPVVLKFDSVAGIELLVAGKPVEAKAETVIDVLGGQVYITLIVDRSKRGESLKVELADAVNSPARAAVVNGK